MYTIILNKVFPIIMILSIFIHLQTVHKQKVIGDKLTHPTYMRFQGV